MRKLLIFCIGLVIIAGCNTSKTKNPTKAELFVPTWESLSKYECPEWFKDAKFGIYAHWGPYSVPAYKTEWYSHYMYEPGHPIRVYHEKTYGTLDKFGYKDFIPLFTAEKFNAEEWADLYVKAGARFAGPVAEHADGFAMWDSKLTQWDAKDMGPKRDIVGEMEKAIKGKGLKFLTSYHRHWLYAWYTTWDKNTDASNPEYSGLYGPVVPDGLFPFENRLKIPPDSIFNKEWLDRLNELMDNYQPDLIWFDNKMDMIGEQYRLQFLSNYYNNARKWNKEVVCTYKFHELNQDVAVIDVERARMSESQKLPWLTDDSVDWEAWCNISTPRYKSTNRLIDVLADIVSKNGCLLLNITPTASGEIPAPVRERLLEMGKWLEINGEAIYETRPWKIFGEGPTKVVEGHLTEETNADNTFEDIRFTTKDDILYAIALGWPEKKLVIKSLAEKNTLAPEIVNVELLGSLEDIEWEQTSEGLVIEMPSEKPCEHAFSFKITL